MQLISVLKLKFYKSEYLPLEVVFDVLKAIGFRSRLAFLIST